MTTPISDKLKDSIHAAIASGKSQSSIARDAGVNRANLCNWLNGRGTITLMVADRVASAIGHK